MKKLHKLTAVLLAAILTAVTVCSVGFSAFAEELRYFERGKLTDGTNTAYYVIDKDNKVLYITGDGNNLAYTPNYPNAASGPFAGRTDITRIVIEEDVAKVGDYALSNMTKVDTLEVQSNLLSSSSSMSSKAMIGCTGLRHIQGDSALLSTDVFLQVVKGALNIASGNWLSLITNGVSIISTGVNGDDSLDNETVHCMVDDYINNENKIFLGDLDEAKAAYNERLANPCYSNNAFHHNYSSAVTTQPTCTQNGEKTFTCATCGDVYTQELAALGHVYTESVLYQPSCFVEGIKKYACETCGAAMYEAIPAYGHHSFDAYTYDAVNDAYTEICTVCGDRNTAFDNDTSALVAAVTMSKALEEEDYTAESFAPLAESTARYLDLTEDDYLQYPQYIVDEKTAEILTNMDALIPYLDVKLSYPSRGSVSLTADGETTGYGRRRIVFGTEVTLQATPQGDATFLGWYEKTTKRFLSNEETYTFKLTSNMDLLARFAESNSATLYFECFDGQIKSYVYKTAAQWNAVESIEALLPEVPYSYGATNVRWEYNEAEVLSALRSGQDYTITISYDEKTVPQYVKPTADEGGLPAMQLYYEYDADYNVGNFIMMADIPTDCQVEEIGIAFYYKNADTFRPESFRLTLNNKMVTSRFTDISDEGFYVVNFKKMSADKNYAARGYISYRDSENQLKAVYTNQINVVNKLEQ